MPSIGAQVRMQATPTNGEPRQEAVKKRTYNTYSNKLFVGHVLTDIVQQIEELPMYQDHVSTWRTKNRLLRIESRDSMQMPEDLLTEFIEREAQKNICYKTVQAEYVKKAFEKAFKDRTDDWIAVISTPLDVANQKAWQLEAFLFAALTSTYHKDLEPVWELSLICTGQLSGIGLTLVQGFVYAAKEYTLRHNTRQLVFLDLANGYANTAGLATYSHVGYSSLSTLLKQDVMSSIIKQRIRDEEGRTEIVTDASVFMAMNLHDFPASDLKSNIGRKGSPAFGSSIDTLLGLAAKINHAAQKAKQKLRNKKIKYVVHDCDKKCVKQVESFIQEAFTLAAAFYNIHDTQSGATFKRDHDALVDELQKVVVTCTTGLTEYTNLLTSPSPSKSPTPSLAFSLGGSPTASKSSTLTSSSGGAKSPTLTSSSGGAESPTSTSSSGGAKSSTLASSSGSTKSSSSASSSGGTKSSTLASSSGGTKFPSSVSSSGGGAFSRLRTYASSSGASSLGTPSHSVSSLSSHRPRATFSLTESPTNPRSAFAYPASSLPVSPTLLTDDDDDDDDASLPASPPTMGVSPSGDLRWTGSSTPTFSPIDEQSVDWNSNEDFAGHGFGTAS